MKHIWWVILVAVASPVLAQTPDVDAARAAVISALQDRLGPGVTIDLDAFSSRLTVASAGALTATPDLAARTGSVVRFALSSGPRGRGLRVGDALALVRVSGTHASAARALAAGSVLTAADIDVLDGPIVGAPLHRVSATADLVGARVLRALAAGDPLVDGAVIGAPVVRAGDRVVATVRDRGVEVSVVAVAEQNGVADQVIRVVNPDSRRAVRARVVSKGEVEVISGR